MKSGATAWWINRRHRNIHIRKRILGLTVKSVARELFWDVLKNNTQDIGMWFVGELLIVGWIRQKQLANSSCKKNENPSKILARIHKRLIALPEKNRDYRQIVAGKCLEFHQIIAEKIMNFVSRRMKSVISPVDRKEIEIFVKLSQQKFSNFFWSRRRSCIASIGRENIMKYLITQLPKKIPNFVKRLQKQA